uniref:G-protein coupled receptors family 1 profile domain-containing protein n=1 Tax=Romanomermis culicivorax TaxID=13658 RepID=A0A915KZ36_ROMCU
MNVTSSTKNDNTEYDLRKLQLIESSKSILQSSTPAFLIFFVAGAVAFVTALISIGAIAKASKLKKKFYVLYAAMSSNDALMGLSFISLAGVKLCKIFAGDDDVTNLRDCCRQSVAVYFSQTFGLYIVACITLDRMLSFATPFNYKNWTVKKFSYPLVALALMITVAEILIMILKNFDMSIIIFIPSLYILVTCVHLLVSFLIILTNIFLLTNITCSPASSSTTSTYKNRSTIYRNNNNASNGYLRSTSPGMFNTPPVARGIAQRLSPTRNGVTAAVSVVHLSDNSAASNLSNLFFSSTINLGEATATTVVLETKTAPMNGDSSSQSKGRILVRPLTVYGRIKKSLLLMIIVHVVSHFATRLILLANILWKSYDDLDSDTVEDFYPETKVVGFYARGLIVINGALHFFVYYNINSRFRQAVKNLFLR